MPSIESCDTPPENLQPIFVRILCSRMRCFGTSESLEKQLTGYLRNALTTQQAIRRFRYLPDSHG